MPQMNPLWWTFLFFMCTLSFFFINSMNYFFYSFSMNTNKKLLLSTKNFWSW